MIMPNGPEGQGDLVIETCCFLASGGYINPPTYIVRFVSVDDEELAMVVPSYSSLVSFCSTLQPSRVRIAHGREEDVSELQAIFDLDLSLH